MITPVEQQFRNHTDTAITDGLAINQHTGRRGHLLNCAFQLGTGTWKHFSTK